jgi:hypothetical protein
MGLTEIRNGLATNLATIDGVQVSAYALQSPAPPTIQILPGGIDYTVTMGLSGFQLYTMTVQAFAAFGNGGAGQLFLDGLMAMTGLTSVSTALESDQTLGGFADQVNVQTCSGVSVATIGGMDVLLIEWTVDVYAKGTV